MAAAGGKKKMLATLVGCNYAGKKGLEEQGSINNAHAMLDVLLDRFGFARDDITVLTDDDPEKLPTGAAIKGALDDMVKRAAPGDVLFFYFSGQGLRSYRADGPGGGVDHLIAPCDFDNKELEEKFITDLYFRELVNRVPAGATFTMVCDSPQSGGLIDQEKEQIGPQLHAGARARWSLPYVVVPRHLSAASPNIADHLVALGNDASAKFHANATRTDGVDADAGILLSACQKGQQVADIVPEDGVGKTYGVFTWALQAVLKADRAPMSNREVVRRAREVLAHFTFPVQSEQLINRGFQLGQHPCLYCSDANADAPFLGQQDTKAAKSN